MISILIFACANLIIFTILQKKKINILLDKPDNIRKFHKKNTPLLGGFIIIFNIIILNIFFFTEFNNLYFSADFFKSNKDIIFFFIIIYSIFLIGLVDDKIKINANVKFVLLFLIILIVLLNDDQLIITDIRISFYEKKIALDNFAIPFSILCYLLFINALNMFDGINLQSGLYSIIVFAYLLTILNNSYYIIYVLILSLITFVILNSKEKIFFGDSGSLTISYIISYFLVKSYNNHYIEFSDDIFIIMMIPGFEIFRLFFTRLLINKKNPFIADNKHIHHFLLKDLGYRNTIVILMILILVPLLLKIININNLIIIIISLFFYIFTIWKFKY